MCCPIIPGHDRTDGEKLALGIIAFPPVDLADENGLLAFGGDLEVDSLYLAYSQGIFPWPISKRYPLAWFAPDPRGILFQSDLHLPRSLKKALKKDQFKVTFNRNFAEVILNCAQAKNRKQQEPQQGTWITPQIIDSYIKFHQADFAFSVEVWLDDEIVGGLYGVRIGKAICGESMFHTYTNASKVALLTLMLHLKKHSIQWLDTQMVTSVVASLGGKEISRDNYMQHLEQSKQLNGDNIFNNKIEYSSADLLKLID